MMKYDSYVYKVVVTLAYDADNKLVAETEMTKERDENGAAIAAPPVVTTAEFSNVYDIGSASVALWMAQRFTKDGQTAQTILLKFILTE